MSSEAKMIVEYAKSGRASCKKCSTTIDSGAPRLGLVTRDSRGFDMTKWHHLQCLPPLSSGPATSPDSITGFSSLKSDDQEELKKLLESSEKIVDGEDDSKSKSEKKSKVRETDDDPEDHDVGESETKKIKVSEPANEGDLDITMSPSDIKDSAPTPKTSSDVKFIVEYAKSGRSSCKKCSTAIAPGEPRLGLVTHNFRGYDMTKWHHFQCIPSLDVATSPDSISGFSSLKSDDQEELKKLIESSEKVHETDVDHEVHNTEKSASKKIKVSKSTEEGELDITMSPSEVKDSDIPTTDTLKPKIPSKAKLIVEYAKSGRSSCKKCSTAIPSGAPRVGLLMQGTRGFDMTKWHHLQCLPLDSDAATSPDTIDGFSSLKSDDQDELKKLIESSAPQVA